VHIEPRMERIKLLVIATVIGALGLFGLRLWSGSSSTDDSSDFDDAGGARVARRTDDGTTGSNGAMPRLGRNRGGGAAASADLDAPGGSRAGSGEHRLDSRLRRGKAEMITGDRRGGTAGGAVGIGAGTRGGPGAGGSGSVSMHLNGSGTGREGRDSSRSELLDAIASQPKSKSTGEFGGPMGAQTNEPDVLLAVNKPEDTENAVESKNVKPAEDGEGISFKDGSDVAYPADLVNTEAGSISFKLTPETWKGSDATDNSFVQIRDPNQWDNRLQIFRNGIYLRFIFTGSSGFESGISYKIVAAGRYASHHRHLGRRHDQSLRRWPAGRDEQVPRLDLVWQRHEHAYRGRRGRRVQLGRRDHGGHHGPRPRALARRDHLALNPSTRRRRALTPSSDAKPARSDSR